jgi:uncharacterized membrane protein
MPIKDFVEHAGNAAEIAGVVLIIGGLILASVRYAVSSAPAGELRYTRYRHDIGRAILLGLEVLVAADIVRTVAITPTMDSVIVLAMIVAILHPSTLLTFGNPPLGTQFITSNPNSGLDWPVRLLVHQNTKGEVWATYTDFAWIAKRHGITDRVEQFKKATGVVESITSSVKAK